MELRTLSRKNTIIALNTKASLEEKSQKTLKNDHKITNNSIQTLSYQSHHAFQYLRGTCPTNTQFKKFVNFLYKSLQYCVKSLKQPLQFEIRRKKILLPQPIGTGHKKILFMDLDQTLVHLLKEDSKNFEESDVKITIKEKKYHFNVRPYCFQFLKQMSKLFNIYVFTAGIDYYAQMIVNYLNKDQKTILGFCHRKHCIQTASNCFIKDLRIVENRQLKDIVIVDNLVHSFGYQIENGIPILEFTDRKDDKQLIGLQQLLIAIEKVDDVRTYLKQKLALRKILQFSESLYIRVENYFSA